MHRPSAFLAYFFSDAVRKNGRPRTTTCIRVGFFELHYGGLSLDQNGSGRIHPFARVMRYEYSTSCSVVDHQAARVFYGVLTSSNLTLRHAQWSISTSTFFNRSWLRESASLEWVEFIFHFDCQLRCSSGSLPRLQWRINWNLQLRLISKSPILTRFVLNSTVWWLLLKVADV